MTKHPRERWWDFSCQMTLYSKMAVARHADCHINKFSSRSRNHLPSRRVPEARRTGRIGTWKRSVE